MKKLLGHIPLIVDESSLPSATECFSFGGNSDLRWPCEEMYRIVRQDAQWQAVVRSEVGGRLPKGAVKLDPESDATWPLRMNAAHYDMMDIRRNVIEPVVRSGDGADSISAEWLNAPFEIEVYVLGNPEYRVFPSKEFASFYRMFDENGSKFFFMVTRRELAAL